MRKGNKNEGIKKMPTHYVLQQNRKQGRSIKSVITKSFRNGGNAFLK